MIKKIMIGILVGIGSILPGVSGGMIAASFDVYAKLIRALDELTKTPIKAVISIWEYLLGILIGVLLGFLVIANIFYLIPLPSTLLFIGLILGGLPEVYVLSKQEHQKFKWISITVLSFLLMLSITIFGQGLNNQGSTDANFLIWIVVGMMLALSLIVPGLSGTMLLLVIGFYTPLIFLGKTMIEAVVTLNIDLLMQNIPTLIYVVIGLILAFIILAKVISFVLKKFPKTFYQVILGIVIAAPINIMISLKDELLLEDVPVDIFDVKTHWLMWVIGLILVPIGIWIARKFIKDSKDETEENQRGNT